MALGQIDVNVKLAVWIIGSDCLAFILEDGVEIDDAICMAHQAYAEAQGWGINEMHQVSK